MGTVCIVIVMLMVKMSDIQQNINNVVDGDNSIAN